LGGIDVRNLSRSRNGECRDARPAARLAAL